LVGRHYLLSLMVGAAAVETKAAGAAAVKSKAASMAEAGLPLAEALDFPLAQVVRWQLTQLPTSAECRC